MPEPISSPSNWPDFTFLLRFHTNFWENLKEVSDFVTLWKNNMKNGFCTQELPRVKTSMKTQNEPKSCTGQTAQIGASRDTFHCK